MAPPTGTTKKPPDKTKFLFNPQMATILVGDKSEKFVVHQELLCQNSKFFIKALTGSFEEGKTGVVKLEDVSPVIFKIFVTWLYHGKLIYNTPNDNSSIEEDFETLNKFGSNTNDKKAPDRGKDSTWPFPVSIESYILGDRLDVSAFRDDSISALHRSIGAASYTLGCADILHICTNTTPQSKLWRYAVHNMAYRWRFTSDSEPLHELPSEFLASVTITMGRRLPYVLCDDCSNDALKDNWIEDADVDDVCKYADLAPYERDLCFYHEHANEKERKACRKLRRRK